VETKSDFILVSSSSLEKPRAGQEQDVEHQYEHEVPLEPRAQDFIER
jgi:hypothetical protein